jgi:hypothetical protein
MRSPIAANPRGTASWIAQTAMPHEDASACALGLNEQHAGDRQEGRDGAADGSGEDTCGRLQQAAKLCISEGRQREQPPLTGRDRSAEHADDQGEMLNDQRRSGDAGVDRTPEDDVRQWQNDHERQNQRHREIFEPMQGHLPIAAVEGCRGHFVPGWAVRYSSTRRLAWSNMSAGTIGPRIFG